MSADEICRRAAIRSRLADAMAQGNGEDPAALLEPQRPGAAGRAMSAAPAAGAHASRDRAEMLQPLCAYRPDPFDPRLTKPPVPGCGYVLHGSDGSMSVRRFVGTRTTPEAAASIAEWRERGVRFTHFSLREAP